MRESAVSGFERVTSFLTNIDCYTRLSILAATADGGGFVIGSTATRVAILESLKQGFIVQARQQLTQTLIRQGIKREVINKRSTGVKSLV